MHARLGLCWPEGKVADLPAGLVHLPSSSPFSYCSGGSDSLPPAVDPRSARLQIASAVRWRSLGPVGLSEQRLHTDESAELSNNVWQAAAACLSGGLEFDEVPSPRAVAAVRSSGFGNWSKAASQALFVFSCSFLHNGSVEKLRGQSVSSCVSIRFSFFFGWNTSDICKNTDQVQLPIA